ncbi:MAG: NADH-quinone oxidoreductase subunit [Solirubrobacterales bacterium]|nr:NADH-quinone oxidoreductase subunit [Solirubrobacterales bacterium]
MAEVLFFLTAIGAITGAVGVIALRNPFYSVLALVAHLISLALLFLLLRAEFVAAAQVIVYAGAVMVLYVFVVSYVGGTQESGHRLTKGFKLASVAFGAALFAVLAIAILGSGLQALDTEGAPYQAGFGSPREIGKLLLTDFLLPFEVASFLLHIAAVGAVTLARRRGGLETQGELNAYTALDFARPAITGTMAEAVGGRHQRMPEPGAGADASPAAAIVDSEPSA